MKEDPLQQGYSRVNQAAPDGTLSNSTTSTSLDTVVIDTSTDNISNSPKLQQQKPRTNFSPILESEDNSNPFADDIKELAKQAKKSNLKGGHISFGSNEGEEADKFDEEAFKKRREHFQKTKSRSEHKSILIRVSWKFFQTRVKWPSIFYLFQDLRAYLDGDLDREQFQSKKHASLDVRSSKQLEHLLKGTTSSSEDEFEHQRKSFQARKHKSLDARHISFKLDKEATPTPSDSSEEDYEERSSLLQIDPDRSCIVIDLNVNIWRSPSTPPQSLMISDFNQRLLCLFRI